ncbi:MAG: hypothetical protein GY943_03150 [Chloroflexi bacterium]|nr:hypothetical protein [Chloroflexota bacterium]
MGKEIEVMQVLRVPPLSKLVVSVNKNRYGKLSELKEGKTKRLLLVAIGELIDFAGGYQELVDAGVAPMMKSPPPMTNTPEPASTPNELQDQQQRFLANLEAERNAIRNTASAKPQISVLSGLRPSIKTSTTPQINNLVDQIDQILQRHLQQDSELSQYSIHFLQSPAGGLQIEIDGQIYQRPREIENKKIQLMIKRALKEWESS